MTLVNAHSLMCKRNCKLAEIASVVSGHQFRGAITHDPAGPMHVVQMRDVSRDAPIPWSRLDRVSPKSATSFLHREDLLFTARGSHNFAVYAGEVPENLKVLVSPHFLHIRVQEPDMLPAFLAWQLNQSFAQSQIAACAVGTTQRSVSATGLRSIEVVMLPVEKQRHVLALHGIFIRERALLNRLMETRDLMMSGLASELLNRDSTVRNN